MILIRKKSENIPLVKTTDGAARPDVIATYVATVQDRLNKVLEISCAYFHSAQTHSEGWDPIPVQGFHFRFTKNSKIPAEKDSKDNILKLGYPDYDEAIAAIAIDENGNITKVSDDMEEWVLNQTFALDFDNKPFGENWEFAD